MIVRLWYLFLALCAIAIVLYGWAMLSFGAPIPGERLVAFCALLAFGATLAREVREDVAELRPFGYTRRQCWIIAARACWRRGDRADAREALRNALKRKSPLYWSTGASLRDAPRGRWLP